MNSALNAGEEGMLPEFEVFLRPCLLLPQPLEGLRLELLLGIGPTVELAVLHLKEYPMFYNAKPVSNFTTLPPLYLLKQTRFDHAEENVNFHLFFHLKREVIIGEILQQIREHFKAVRHQRRLHIFRQPD